METLRAGDAAVTIDAENGGRLASLRVGGHELLRGRAEGEPDAPTSWGCFPMVPWAGRIRRGRFVADGTSVTLPIDMPPHAIHGTTKDRAWRVDAPGTISTELGDDWPWTGRATHEVALEPQRLTLTLAVHAGETMPVSAGWHPWFHRRIGGAEAEIDLPAERMWRRDEEGIPDGTLVDPPPGPWDDCFTALVGPVVVRWPGVLTLIVESDCEHVVVYDEVDDFVCVEPQSAPPDAHNSGEDLVLVPAGTTWAVSTTWTWTVDGG